MNLFGAYFRRWHLNVVLALVGASWSLQAQNSGSSWHVESGLGLPVVSTEPLSRTNNAGTTVSFIVRASGTPPFAYQWHKDGTNLENNDRLTGAQDSILILSNLFGGDGGGYWVVVTSPSGSVTSQVATLSVADPFFVAPPTGQVANLGGTVTFSLAAGGTSPFGYQWRKEGSELAGATNAELILTNLQLTDRGGYDVVLSNRFGMTTSALAQLSLFPTVGNVDPEPDGSVLALGMQPDGKLLVGGYFTNLCGQPRRFLARLSADGSLDLGFCPNIDGPFDTYWERAMPRVRSIALQPDGKILVGGNFLLIAGCYHQGIGRLNPDGSVDPTFEAMANDEVSAVVLQPDGKILVGGRFTSLAGVPRVGLGRLNADGTLDATFDPQSAGSSSHVDCLALQPDGRILVGGVLELLGWRPFNGLGRLNADGTLDTTFTAPIAREVDALLVQPDNRILACGLFHDSKGWSCSGPCRLQQDGSPDASFGGFNDSRPTMFLALQTDGRVLSGHQDAAAIRRLDPNGSLDSSFNVTLGSQHPYVYAVVLQPDGKVWVGGYFDELAGHSRTNLGLLNNTDTASQSLSYDGATITWLRNGTGPEVWRTTFESSTNGADWLYLGAGAYMPGGWRLSGAAVPANSTIRARGYVVGGIRNGSSWFVEEGLGAPLIVRPPLGQTVNAGATIQLDVSAAGSAPLFYRWLKNGVELEEGGMTKGAHEATLILTNVTGGESGAYTVIVSNFQGSVTSQVATLTVVDPFIIAQPASQPLVAGGTLGFSVVAGGTAPLAYQWRKDGVAIENATNASLALTNAQIADLGGYDAVLRNSFGCVTSSVAFASMPIAVEPFGPVVQGGVLTMAVQPDGKILVGGEFTNLCGEARLHLGRLHPDGTLDTSFNSPAGVPYSGVQALAVQTDGRILVGGYFTNLCGQTRINLGRLNADGTLDESFTPSVYGSYSYYNPSWAPVCSLTLQPDGQILVAGYFTNLCGYACTNLGRLHSDGSFDASFNPGVIDGPVRCIALQADGGILVGGRFTSISGVPRDSLGRFRADGTLDRTFTAGVGYNGANGDVNCLALQSEGKILVGGYFSSLVGREISNLGRLNASGSLDASFNPHAGNQVYTMAPQANGDVLLAGTFMEMGGQARKRIARIHGDGTLDTNFNIAITRFVYALTVQPDGQVLVGGDLTSLGGLARNGLARLTSLGPATQALSCDGSTITWLRGGASPEVWRTAFDVSTNGINWAALGSGSRIAGGWQLGGLDLPTNATVRARGFNNSGSNPRASWFLEASAPVTIPPPQAPVFTAMPKLVSGGYQLELGWKAGRSLEIWTSTNLADWLRLTTLSNSSGSSPFLDPATGVDRRFYRLRQP